jgi:Uma2 family endonuclease
MVNLNPAPELLEFDAFLALYGEREGRFELHDGEAFAMAGGSEKHSLITINVAVALRSKARPRGCQTHGPDLYVRPEDDNRQAMSPDVMVRCGPPLTTRYAPDPLIVVEVLSPSTEAFDRGNKLERYKTFQSLQHIVLVYTDEYRVEVYNRATGPDPETPWVRVTARAVEESFHLSALDAQIPLAEVYDQVVLSA